MIKEKAETDRMDDFIKDVCETISCELEKDSVKKIVIEPLLAFVNKHTRFYIYIIIILVVILFFLNFAVLTLLANMYWRLPK